LNWEVETTVRAASRYNRPRTRSTRPPIQFPLRRPHKSLQLALLYAAALMATNSAHGWARIFALRIGSRNFATKKANFATERLTSRSGWLRKANFALMQLLVPVREEGEDDIDFSLDGNWEQLCCDQVLPKSIDNVEAGDVFAMEDCRDLTKNWPGRRMFVGFDNEHAWLFNEEGRLFHRLCARTQKVSATRSQPRRRPQKVAVFAQ